MGRLSILWKHGGLYVDADTQCLKPIEGLVRTWEYAGHKLVMSEQPNVPRRQRQIGSAFTFSVPRHHVLAWMIGEQQRRVAAKPHTRTPHAVLTTGPDVWRTAVEQFPDEILVTPQWMFQPLEEHLLNKRVNMSRLPPDVPIPEKSYAVHHASSLWGPQPWGRDGY